MPVSLTIVSAGADVAGVSVVESTAVLSEDPETLFVELHAETARIIEPAKARLKIVFFIIIDLYVHQGNIYRPKRFAFEGF